MHNLLTTSVHNLMTLTVHEVLTLYTNYADNRYQQPLFRNPRDTPSHQVVSPQKLWPHRYGASAASGTTHTPSARRNAGPVGTMTRSATASGTTLAAAALR